MADRDFILAPATASTTVSIDLEPVFNIVNSLMLLSMPEERSGFNDWIPRTAASLSSDQRQTHRLIFSALFSLVEPQQIWPSFPAYLDHLAALTPEQLRDRSLAWIYDCDECADLNPPPPAELLGDQAVYLAFIEQVYAKKAADKDGHVMDRTLYEQAHAVLNDAPALHTLVIHHLHTMWEDYLAPEWARTVPMLEESVAAFRELDYSHMSALEAARIVTGRDLSGVWDEWAEQVVFIPSAHIGPYVTRFDTRQPRITRVIFGARLPEGARVTSPALSRSELLVRLSALADDTRLRILELLTQHQELCAQDVIEMLDLSQSAASRHLRQLTATGFLIERRREVAKCYSLNPRRLDDTLQAMKRFLRTR